MKAAAAASQMQRIGLPILLSNYIRPHILVNVQFSMFNVLFEIVNNTSLSRVAIPLHVWKNDYLWYFLCRILDEMLDEQHTYVRCPGYSLFQVWNHNFLIVKWEELVSSVYVLLSTLLTHTHTQNIRCSHTLALRGCGEWILRLSPIVILAGIYISYFFSAIKRIVVPAHTNRNADLSYTF